MMLNPTITNNDKRVRLYKKLCKECRCRTGILVCFGVPLLPPSAILLGVAFGGEQKISVFHICGLVLTSISLTCIFLAVAIVLFRKWQHNKRRKTFEKTRDALTNSTDLKRTESRNTASERLKAATVTVVSEADITPRKKKNRKRKGKTKKTKLPPVKEEDCRVRTDRSGDESETGYRRAASGKSQKRNNCDWKLDQDNSKTLFKDGRGTLCKEDLKVLGSLEDARTQGGCYGYMYQIKRSWSMSDLGDSESERTESSVDWDPMNVRQKYGRKYGSERNKIRKTKSHGRLPSIDAEKPEVEGGAIAMPVLTHHSSERTGVRTSRWTTHL